MIVDGVSTPEWFDGIPEVNYEKRPLEGFSLADAELVCSVYVCAQCEGQLKFVAWDWGVSNLYFVECPDCGNVEEVGRISKTTVAIRNERGVFDFPKAIRALPEFWGSLIPTKEDRERTIQELGF